MAVSWCFDGDDLLCGVGASWAEFALANDGDGCVPPLLGQGLDAFVSSPELVVVWQTIFDLTRRDHGRPLTLTYRCDAPGERRLIRATVTGDAYHQVEIVSSVSRRGPRPPIPLLDPAPAVRRSGEMVRMCAWCARVDADGWVDVEEACRRLGLLESEAALLPGVTHGICDDCRGTLIGDLDLPPGLDPHHRHHIISSAG
ncbi:hypothetical protein [Paractinoplanes durhamensis]|uniref:Uncharacterized protein n=1 Tax=Paractinoplanes durhamensis TaxID=113563 RepID=A0ABQ3ZDM8_9ACTN|nr:hypothetical protein [Actinoplanes durhamensis]GIE07931.1 hypothetical protein Adu01nite_92810 [Actinoplanes durhamensis]